MRAERAEPGGGRGGACLFSKRLERGRFVWPSAKDGKISLTPAQLSMLLEGIDWRPPGRFSAQTACRVIVAAEDLEAIDRGELSRECRAVGFPYRHSRGIFRTMLDAPKTLPSDPGQLRATAEGLLDLVKAQALRIAKLEHQLAGHNRHRFGSKSENLDQLQLRLEEETAAAQNADAGSSDGDAKGQKVKPRRKPLPPELPRIDQVLTPGDACTCGGKLRAISEDVTEELEYIPGRVHHCT